ncbi:unnamed protein product [Ixodes pacificus]
MPSHGPTPVRHSERMGSGSACPHLGTEKNSSAIIGTLVLKVSCSCQLGFLGPQDIPSFGTLVSNETAGLDNCK